MMHSQPKPESSVSSPSAEVDKATPREMAIRALTIQNPRFALYREQDPDFREDDVRFWTEQFVAAVNTYSPDTSKEYVRGLNLFRQLVSGKNKLRDLDVFACNDGEHDAGCECFWEQCEAWAKAEDLDYQRRLYDECVTAGWDAGQQNTFAEEIAHLHEELSEAFREWRRHKNFDIRHSENGKPEGIPIELADVLIGLFYNAELHGFDLFAAVEEKHRFNLTRNYMTEGRQLHNAPERDAESDQD